MKRFVSIWLAVSSLLFAALMATAATRPQYGGTLHVTMRESLSSLDPADTSDPDSFARRSVTGLMFDTLVRLDDTGHVNPVLAESWQSMRGNQRWQLRLRHGVKLHDGSALTADVAAASLRFANPAWNVSSDGDAVIIEVEGANPELLSELALPRNANVKRDGDRPSGTGPFHLVDWQPGRKLTLAANEDCWRGRPFLDGIEIEMAKNYREQMTALDLGKTDLAEVAPEQTHRVSQEGHRLANSAPMELVALLFIHDANTQEEKSLRQALALSIERGSMRSVLLQGAGQPTASILPTWISGYGFVFSADADLAKARQLRSQVRTAPAWTLGYDSNDPLARLLADRIALNARDAGLSVQPTPSVGVDLRLVRIPLASSDPWIALEDVISQAGLPAPRNRSGSAEELYATEQAAIANERVMPLFHLPVSEASSSNLRNWALRAEGSLDLDDAWLETTKP